MNTTIDILTNIRKYEYKYKYWSHTDTIQYNTIHYNTIQYNTIQYNAALPDPVVS